MLLQGCGHRMYACFICRDFLCSERDENGKECRRQGLEKGGFKARPMIKAVPVSIYARPMPCSNSFHGY